MVALKYVFVGAAAMFAVSEASAVERRQLPDVAGLQKAFEKRMEPCYESKEALGYLKCVAKGTLEGLGALTSSDALEGVFKLKPELKGDLEGLLKALKAGGEKCAAEKDAAAYKTCIGKSVDTLAAGVKGDPIKEPLVGVLKKWFSDVSACSKNKKGVDTCTADAVDKVFAGLSGLLAKLLAAQ